MKMINLWLKPAVTVIMIGLLLSLTISETTAQTRNPGDVGIGFQAGQPTGITIKIYKPNGMSPDFLAAWDLDDFFFLNVHGTFSHHLDDEQRFHFFYGPGAFIGIQDRPSEFEDDVILGVSAMVGFNVMVKKLEIFIQGTPRLGLVEATRFDMGGGIGLRYYL